MNQNSEFERFYKHNTMLGIYIKSQASTFWNIALVNISTEKKKHVNDLNIPVQVRFCDHISSGHCLKHGYSCQLRQKLSNQNHCIFPTAGESNGRKKGKYW